MLSFIRNHWGKCIFALSSFIWAACTDDAQPMNSGAQPPSESSSSTGDCLECTYGISVTDPVSSSSIESSSSVESSSSAIPMSIPAYGIPPVDCYTAQVQSTTGSSYDIFECDNGRRFLKDYQVYSESLKEKLPDDILWSAPDKFSGEGRNCNFDGPSLCVDKMDAEGHMYGGCMPTIECPYKEDKQ